MVLKKNITLLLLLLLTLTGCWSTPIQKVTLPQEREYRGEVVSGTLVEIHTVEGEKIIFDRRGRASILEDMIKLYAIDKLAE